VREQIRASRMERGHAAECDALRTRADAAAAAASTSGSQVAALTRDNKALEKKLHHLTSKFVYLSFIFIK
jgi:hypothetical protein